MIDWHSHILPSIDDGPSNVAESVSLVDMLSSQGIDTIIATPHFYANDESVESFLNRRKASYDLLKSNLKEESPNIILGAEVRYYSGISRMEDLKSLRIEGSKLLLLEMPMTKWTEYMVRELIELSGKSKIKIVLAHVERYFSYQSAKVFDELLGCGVLMQTNASFFGGILTKKKALSLISNGRIHFIGSDCHNLTSRAPRIDRAINNISKKLGNEFLDRLSEYGYSMLPTSCI